MVRELRQNLDIRTISLNEAESSIRHLNKTLESLSNGFDQVKEDNEKIMAENLQLHSRIRDIENTEEVLQGQISNLLKFIEELEQSNKELMKHLDTKNYNAAEKYKSQVRSALETQQLRRNKAPLRSQEALSKASNLSEKPF